MGSDAFLAPHRSLGRGAQSCELGSSHWSTDPSQTTTVKLALRLVAKGDRICITGIAVIGAQHSGTTLHSGISKRFLTSSSPVGILYTDDSPGLVRRSCTMQLCPPPSSLPGHQASKNRWLSAWSKGMSEWSWAFWVLGLSRVFLVVVSLS